MRTNGSLGSICALALIACAHEPSNHEPLDAAIELADVGLTDVTILYPLPGGTSADPLIPIDAEGRGGALLPAAVLAQIPPLDRNAPNEAARIRVVGVRLDPCFPVVDLGGATPCRRQIRLVAQPLRTPPNATSIAAADAALHLLYDVDETTLREALARIVAASRAAGTARDAPLTIHPALMHEGLHGSFARTVRDVVLASVGAANLVRVTFVTREPARQVTWRFGGFDVRSGDGTAMSLVALAEPAQLQTLSLQIGGVFRTMPEGAASDDASLYFDPNAARAATEEARRDAWVAALRIEHPDRHSPETVDCSTCHVVAHLREDAERQFGFADEPTSERFIAEGFALSDPYPPPAGGQARERIRALGYFEREPRITERVLHESAKVVLAIRAGAI